MARQNNLNRRDFLYAGGLAGVGLSWSLRSLGAGQGIHGNTAEESGFQELMRNLLKQWCDGMVRVQINKPDQPALHGALGCPACNKIHGRCMDAVYPLLHMAHTTGDERYLDAGIAVFEWSKNVTMEDGSWTVIPDPKSWRGITVFGAIALAEALHYHGDLLDAQRRSRWMERLGRAGDYVYKNFNLSFTNVNYGFTAVYALHLLGRVLDNPAFAARSRELAQGVKEYFTEPNKLLFGEGKPSDRRSPRGLLPVDLGYNVEASLNGVVMYALAEKDEELLQLLTISLESHLEFMLPDGAWDNSWGTRQAKWSYWGSRTTDGCLPGFGMMAHRNPAFGTAALRSTELLQRCTDDGLLHGGPHYVSHGVKPCVHHTFAHAKVLATLLDAGDKLPRIDGKTPLPRTVARGVKAFPEVATWLVARGPWRGTVTTYDWVYREHAQQATGGALSVLYHTEVGLLFAASMARYMLVERNNQQPNPGEDFALTPRVESFNAGVWYTNLWDLQATATYREQDQAIVFSIDAQLENEDRQPVSGTNAHILLDYGFSSDKVTLQARRAKTELSLPMALVIPVVSPSGEKVVHTSPQRIAIEKKEGTVVVEANVPLHIKKTEHSRVFNMVPGVEAVPIIARLPADSSEALHCSITVI